MTDQRTKAESRNLVIHRLPAGSHPEMALLIFLSTTREASRLEVLIFLAVVGFAFFAAAGIALIIPAAYVFSGWLIARHIEAEYGKFASLVVLLVFLAIPTLYWRYEWQSFESRCYSLSSSTTVRVKSRVRGLEFELGYPQHLMANMFGEMAKGPYRLDFYEMRLDPKSYSFDIGDKVHTRCLTSTGSSTRCSTFSTAQSEYLLQGGDVMPVPGSLGQYERSLKILRISDNQIVAERPMALWGGGVFGLLKGFFTGSQFLVCEPNNPVRFGWLGRLKTEKDFAREEMIFKKDADFILSVIDFGS